MTSGVPFDDPRAEHREVLPALHGIVDRLAEPGEPIEEGEVEAFERDVAQALGVRHAVGVASGTDALWAALSALDVGPGDEVVTSALGGFAAASATVRLGARPVFVDVDPDTLVLDPALVPAAVTERTRAIVPVHLHGQPADLGVLGELAGAFSISLVEDAAHAYLATTGDRRRAGTVGALGCFSFGPLASPAALGEAGLVTSEDPGLSAHVRLLRARGTSEGVHALPGANVRLDALHASVLRAKLPRVGGWIEARRAHAVLYELLLHESGLTPHLVQPIRRAHGHVHHRYLVRVKGGRRDALEAHLIAQRIGCAVLHPVAASQEPCFVELGGARCPEAERAAGELLALPMHATLAAEQIERVVDAIAEHFAP